MGGGDSVLSTSRLTRASGATKSAASGRARTSAGHAEVRALQQVFRLERRVDLLNGPPPRTEVSYGVTSLAPAAASPARLLALVRGAWPLRN